MNISLNKQLHGLLTQCGLNEQKAALINSYTAGRSESSKDLTDGEAAQLICFLATKANEHGEAANKMRRKILSMAHEMHWHLPDTQKVDIECVNDWCIAYGFGKKLLNKYTYNELPKLVTQFTQVYKSYISKI
jgi:hypothetical protein